MAAGMKPESFKILHALCRRMDESQPLNLDEFEISDEEMAAFYDYLMTRPTSYLRKLLVDMGQIPESGTVQ